MIFKAVHTCTKILDCAALGSTSMIVFSTGRNDQDTSVVHLHTFKLYLEDCFSCEYCNIM